MQIIDFIKKNGRKKIILSAAVLIVLGVVFLIVKSCGNSAGNVYSYEKVKRGEVEKTISVSGTLSVMNSYVVLSKISGSVSTVTVDFNQNVKKNQLLAIINSSDLEQQMLRASARFDKAKLDLEGGRMELETKKSLFKDNLISKKDMDQAVLKYRKLATLMREAQVEYTIALKNKSNTRITSPVYGVVISRSVKPMDLVTPNQELFVIAEDLKKMYLTINIDESDIGKIKMGQKVSFTVSAFPDRVFSGKIHQVRLKPINRGGIVMYDSIVICDNKELLLKPGMTATATVIVDKRTNVLRVRNESLIISPVEIREKSDKSYVWVKKNVSVNQIPVERCEVVPKLVGNTFTEITSRCVKEGDSILVAIGKKIKIKDTRFSK